MQNYHCKSIVLLPLILVFVSILVSPYPVFSAETSDKKSDANVLAKIGNEVITKEDLEAALKTLPMRNWERYRDKFLDHLIENKVFSKEARKAGLDKDPQIKQSLDRTTNETLARYFVMRYVNQKVEPSEDEIKKYYSDHKDQFVVPEGVFLQLIVVKGKEAAEALLQELKEGVSFEELAKNKSIARSWKEGGRLGWLYKGNMDPELEKVAFNLKKGELSDVIKTKRGYQIIKVLEKSDKSITGLEEAKANIRTMLSLEKKRKLIDNYYKEARVNREPSEKGVLFKIGDEVFKEEIIASILAKAPEKERENLRRRWVAYLIENTVFSREARKVALEKDPEVADELVRGTDKVLANAFKERFIDNKIQVTDKDIADYYQSHPEEFKIPLRVRVKTILVKEKEEAENILKELKEGVAFEILAEEKSIHPAASYGGELGWFGRGEKELPLEAAAFSLEKGQISDIIKTEEGYQIIKVIDRKGGNLMPLEKAEEKIKMKLIAQRFQKEKQRYYEKDGVKIIKDNNQ
jgi:peptidyl-prolyl cis-trans isomerase C